MRPLFLLLLAAISVQAQTLADLARSERLRKADLQSVRIFTADQVRSPAAAAALPAVPAAAAAVPAAATKPLEDAGKKYAEQLVKLRSRVIALQDQETALQLQLNDFKNQFLSPVTDLTARSQAQNRLEQAQSQLAATQTDLANARRLAAQWEAAGPLKP